MNDSKEYPKIRKTPKGVLLRVGTAIIKEREKTVDVFFSKVRTRDGRVVYPVKLSFLVYDDDSHKFTREWGTTEWYEVQDLERLSNLIHGLLAMKVEAKTQE